MSKKINWLKVFDKLSKAQWNENGRVNDGVNCFSLMIKHLNETGHNVPVSEDGVITGEYTFDNVFEKFEKENKKTVEAMTEYLIQWAREIPLNKMKIGDIIVVHCAMENKLFPAIYSGHAKFLTITPNGTIHLKLTTGYKIKHVYRGHNQI